MRDELDEVLSAFFRGTMGLAEGEGIDRLVELDLSMTQARLLHHLAFAGRPLPINELAARLHLSVATTGRTVDQLVHTDLVERREDAADRRVKLVSLTPAGAEAVDQHVAAKRAAVRTLVDRLPQDQAERLLAAIKPIVAGDALRRPTQEDC